MRQSPSRATCLCVFVGGVQSSPRARAAKGRFGSVLKSLDDRCITSTALTSKIRAVKFLDALTRKVSVRWGFSVCGGLWPGFPQGQQAAHSQMRESYSQEMESRLCDLSRGAAGRQRNALANLRWQWQAYCLKQFVSIRWLFGQAHRPANLFGRR